MSTRINIETDAEAKKILLGLHTLPAEMIIAIAKAMDRENQFTIGHIQRDYLSFPKDGPASPIGLRVQSGRLRGSINASKAAVVGQAIESGIGSNVDYAGSHEFGATIPAQTIYPKNAQALRFIIGGRVIFAKSVKIGERQLPARAPIQRGIADRMDDYTAAFSRAVVETWNKN